MVALLSELDQASTAVTMRPRSLLQLAGSLEPGRSSRLVVVESRLRLLLSRPASLSLPLLPKVGLLWLVSVKGSVILVGLRLLPFALAMWTMIKSWSCSAIVTSLPARHLHDMYRLLLVFYCLVFGVDFSVNLCFLVIFKVCPVSSFLPVFFVF